MKSINFQRINNDLFSFYLIGVAIDISRTLFIYHGPPETTIRRIKTCLVVLIEMVTVAERRVITIEEQLT